jgi:hypothetical protein
MREYARDISTSLIGGRTHQEIKLEREKQLSANRYTKIDDKIKLLCNGTFSVDLEKTTKTDRARYVARLEHLRSIGLCRFVNGNYKLEPRWEEELKANGRYNTYLDSKKRLQWTLPSKLKVYSGEDGKITGKISKIYKIDNGNSFNYAVLVEGVNGKAYYVPLMKEPRVKEGDLVSLNSSRSHTGRLTNGLVGINEKEMQKIIRQNNYNGALAQNIIGNAQTQSISRQ